MESEIKSHNTSYNLSHPKKLIYSQCEFGCLNMLSILDLSDSFLDEYYKCEFTFSMDLSLLSFTLFYAFKRKFPSFIQRNLQLRTNNQKKNSIKVHFLFQIFQYKWINHTHPLVYNCSHQIQNKMHLFCFQHLVTTKIYQQF